MVKKGLHEDDDGDLGDWSSNPPSPYLKKKEVINMPRGDGTGSPWGSGPVMGRGAGM